MVLQEAIATLSVSTLAAIALPVLLMLVLMVCLSCLRKKTTGGFSNFSNSAETTNTSHAHVNTTFSADIDDTNVDDANSTAITLEPLPDINTKAKLTQCPLRPRMGYMEEDKQDASLKMIAVHHPFPRSQIMYLKELGSGWFGKVIESDAEKITSGVARSKVVVKMLKDDASKDEQQLFFDEVAPFRELEHPNIIRVLGQCTEINPMLMIMESAAFGNLKQYLRSHRNQQAALVHRNRLIQFALDVSSGLACLHGHKYLHRDLATRNCLVMSDHTLKIGDYGIAEDLFKEDYLTSGGDLLPIRWMAPETLKQENGTWTSHSFSKESDIWSLGVVLWEIAMLGERPYDMLTDEAVLQGVIVDKDIRLPVPDIGIPQKDRLYEVMRFCWLEPSERTKVDEVYKLLQQIASKSPEHGASNDAITVFEQKWEHLMPNQRHPSVDSIDDNRLGSVSSEDSNILADALAQPYSLEELTTPQVQPLPQAPPRASRKKVSAAAIEIPKADMSSARPAATKKQAKEQTAPPQINVIDETGRNTTTKQVQAALQAEESSKPEESKRQSASDIEFTEFTSHSSDDKTPDTSEIVPDAFPDKAIDSSPAKTSTDVGAVGDPFQVDSLESGFFTPDRLEAEAKARKTSTPYAKGEASPSSPSSSSSLSGGDSSATFVTASTSSLGNFTDAYATASDSTLITGPAKTNFTSSSDASAFGNLSGDSSLSFEILDTTAVPPVSNDSSKSEEESQNTQMSGPFSPAASSSTNPFTVGIGSIPKDDGFGEFTDASVVDQNSSNAAPSPSTALAPLSDSSAAQNDFFSLISESPETVSKQQSSEASSGIEKPSSESKPTTQEADVLVSFETDLSSVSSQDVKKSGEKLDKEQIFPSFISEFSSLDSLSADSTATPQAEPQGDNFAFDNTVQPPESEMNSASYTETEAEKTPLSLDDFSVDFFSSVPNVADSASTTATRDGSSHPGPDLFGDFSSIPFESSSTNNPFTGLTIDVSPVSGNQSGMQQPATNLSASGEPEASTHDSSFEVLGSQESSRASATSETFSDFDMLSNFASPPASSTSPSNPFSGGEGLLQDLAGSTLAAAPAPVQKESQDDVLVVATPSDANKSPGSSLLNFEFESPNTTASTEDEGNAEKKTSEGNSVSSLIDF